LATPTRTPARLDGLQALRAFAAIGVVLFHANNYFLPMVILRGEDAGNFLRIGQHGVEVFFVLSGFLMMRARGGEIGRPGRPAAFLKRRFLRIFPFYWAVLGAIGLGLALEPKFGLARSGMANLAESALLLPGLGEPVMRVAWTLQHELMFYLAFALMIARPAMGRGALLVWMAACMVGPALASMPAPFDRVLSPFNLCFGIGMLAAIVAPRIPRRAGAALVALGAVIFLAGAMGEMEGAPWGAGARVAIFGLASAPLVLGLSARGRVPPPLLFAGEASYAIYLTHGTALTLFGHALAGTALPERLPSGVVLMLVSGLAVGAGLLAHLAVERPLLALVRNGAGGVIGAARSLIAAPGQAGRRRS
jgi:peptidoglycan/LPS O-acetylase OafA/YrhL